LRAGLQSTGSHPEDADLENSCAATLPKLGLAMSFQTTSIRTAALPNTKTPTVSPRFREHRNSKDFVQHLATVMENETQARCRDLEQQRRDKNVVIRLDREFFVFSASAPEDFCTHTLQK
jgi:hypothetical protein